MNDVSIRRVSSVLCLALGASCLGGCGGTAEHESVATGAHALELGESTVFYAPKMNKINLDAVKQVSTLKAAGRHQEAALIERMIETPQAVWLEQGSPADVERQARQLVKEAAGKRQIPVLVAYNVPFRDCAQFSAGGATTATEYLAWIDAVAAGIGDANAVVILEPDSIGIIPFTRTLYGADDWCQPSDADPATASDERYSMLNAAVDALKVGPNTKVYLDGTHGAWLGVPEAAWRLERAGVRRADGFFLNVSNYRHTDESITFGTWVSKVLAIAADPPEWALTPEGAFHYDWLPGQHVEVEPGVWKPVYSPENVAWVTAFYESWGGQVATTPFVIDTSRNGLGPWTLEGAPGDVQDWCNPPERGLGLAPTTSTGHELVDALLWVKTPGESDGQCNRWEPIGSPDPVRGMMDPDAGDWFPEMALELAQNAHPPL